jgi:hypothetical protein
MKEVCLLSTTKNNKRIMVIDDDKGIDVFGKTSDVIAAHGCCNGYEPDFDTINEKEKK